MMLTVAIDGPAAAGKGTLARRVAAAHNLAYLDSGSLYRGTALTLLRDGAVVTEAEAVAAAQRLKPELLTDPELRAGAAGGRAAGGAAGPAGRAARRRGRRGGAGGPPAGK